jgi:hypothetical protein
MNGALGSNLYARGGNKLQQLRKKNKPKNVQGEEESEVAYVDRIQMGKIEKK